MRDPFLNKILSIQNPAYNTRALSWDVLNHETNMVTSFPVKLDALIYQRTLQHATVYFNWYEDSFASSNFFVEPCESLSELKRLRAQEIRDTYSYVRLWFSGGSDSTTALNAFVDNGIHIDEIVVYTFPDKNITDPLLSSNRELLLSAKPYLKLLEPKLVNTKITDISLTFSEYQSVLSGPDKLGYVPYMHSMDSGSFLYGLNSSQYVWDKVLRETEHENYCDVYGGTKVMVCVKDDNFYMYMADTGIPDMALSQRGEDFFISRKNPKLFIKTAHMLKNNALRNNMTPQQLIALQKKNENSPAYNNAIGRDAVMNNVALYKADRGTGSYSENVGTHIINYKNYLLVENMSKDEEWRRLFIKHQENLNIMQNDFSWIWNTNDFGNPDPRAGYRGHISKLYSLDRFYIDDNANIFKNGFLNYTSE
jgi:hypothetical protein